MRAVPASLLALFLLSAVVQAVTYEAYVPEIDLQFKAGHPKLFGVETNLALWRCRAGIGLQTDCPQGQQAQWQTHAQQYALLRETADGPHGRKEQWAIVYLLLKDADPASAESYAQRVVAYIQNIVATQPLEDNNWYRSDNREWYYLTHAIAYDFMYEYLQERDPGLLEEYAAWLRAENDFYNEGNGQCDKPGSHFGSTGGQACNPVLLMSLLLYEDAGIDTDQAFVNLLIDSYNYKMEDLRVLDAINYGGYSGYLHRSGLQDGDLAFAFNSIALNTNFFDLAPNHFRNVARWTVYSARDDFRSSDQTGDGESFGYILRDYVMLAGMYGTAFNQGWALWFVDKALMPEAQGGQYEKFKSDGWRYIVFLDKMLSREDPDQALEHALHLGDLTHADLDSSKFSFLRSDFQFGAMTADSLLVPVFGGPFSGGHDHGWNTGHFAVFRGVDALTTSAGFYEHTSTPHNKFFNSKSIAFNTMLIADPQSAYPVGGNTNMAREGIQFHDYDVPPSPSTRRCGNQFLEDRLNMKCWNGGVERFSDSRGDYGYVFMNTTFSYPNWPYSVDGPGGWPLGWAVNYSTRQFVMLGDAYLAILDRVKVADPSFKKSFVLHSRSLESPELIDGTFNGGTPAHPGARGGTPGEWSTSASGTYWDVGASRLYTHVIFPLQRRLLRVGGYDGRPETAMRLMAPASGGMLTIQVNSTQNVQAGDTILFSYLDQAVQNTQVRRVESVGTGSVTFKHALGSSSYPEGTEIVRVRFDSDESFDYYFRESETNYAMNLTTSVSGWGELAWEDGIPGLWRIEVEPEQSNEEEVFLSVLEPTDMAAAPSSVEPIDATEFAGVQVTSQNTRYAALFGKQERLYSSAAYTLPGGIGQIKHFVADLSPGVYSVSRDGNVLQAGIVVLGKSNVLGFGSDGGGTFIITSVPLPTCEEQGGNECGSNEQCNGNWVPSGDSDRCCVGECVIPSPTPSPTASPTPSASPTPIVTQPPNPGGGNGNGGGAYWTPTPEVTATLKPSPTPETPIVFVEVPLTNEEVEAALLELPSEDIETQEAHQMITQAKDLEESGQKEEAKTLWMKAKEKVTVLLAKARQNKASFNVWLAGFAALAIIAGAVYYSSTMHSSNKTDESREAQEEGSPEDGTQATENEQA